MSPGILKKLLAASMRGADAEEVRERPCDGCTFCCTAPGISKESYEGISPEGKPACVTCKFATEGACSVYDKRPELCREYLCGYALGWFEDRPDQKGWAWSLQPDFDGGGVMMTAHTKGRTANLLDNETFLKEVREIWDANCFTAIAARSELDAICILPNGDIRQAQINLFDPLRLEIRQETDIKIGEYRPHEN